MKFVYYLLFFVLCSKHKELHSQQRNLIANGSFEEYDHFPEDINQFEDNLFNWSIPTIATTDFFHPKSKIVGIPKNFIGEQAAKDGKNYAGFYAFGRGNYREYIQGKLKEPLVKGKEYKISFYVSIADNSTHAVRAFGVLFSSEKLLLPIKTVIKPDLLEKRTNAKFTLWQMKNQNFYKSTDRWILVTKKIIASGNEKYIVLGNFEDNAFMKTKSLKKQYTNILCYYYIDDIKLECISPEEKIEIGKEKDFEKPVVWNGSKDSILIEKTYIFKNILFDTDKSKLKNNYVEELDTLSEYLKENSETNVELSGHTDNTGTFQRNEVLSHDRAKTIAKYLIAKGIDSNRIHWDGYGSSIPISNNETIKGKSLNRRVEFKIF